MAIHRAPVNLMQPENGVYFEPASVTFEANDRYPGTLLAFPSQTLKQGCGGAFQVPNNYVGTASIVIDWSAIATSGDAVWAFAYTPIGGDGTETMDPSSDAEALTVTDTVSGTARRKMQATINLTGANLAAGDYVRFTVSRDGAAGADTLAATAWIALVMFVYADV